MTLAGERKTIRTSNLEAQSVEVVEVKSGRSESVGAESSQSESGRKHSNVLKSSKKLESLIVNGSCRKALVPSPRRAGPFKLKNLFRLDCSH